jgi:hypothetical protein
MSQEILTQEKICYLFFQGLLMLQTLYNYGIYHGSISADTLKLSDDYTLKLADFELSCF